MLTHSTREWDVVEVKVGAGISAHLPLSTIQGSPAHPWTEPTLRTSGFGHPFPLMDGPPLPDPCYTHGLHSQSLSRGRTRREGASGQKQSDPVPAGLPWTPVTTSPFSAVGEAWGQGLSLAAVAEPRSTSSLLVPHGALGQSASGSRCMQHTHQPPSLAAPAPVHTLL